MHGRIRKYETVSQLMGDWMALKMEFMAKRKASMLASYGAEVDELDDHIKFVEAVVARRIDIRKPTKEVETMVKALGVSDERTKKFLDMALRSISKDKVDALRTKRADTSTTLQRLSATSEATLYKADLKTLRKEVVKFYAADGASSAPKGSKKRKACGGSTKQKKAKK